MLISFRPFNPAGSNATDGGGDIVEGEEAVVSRDLAVKDDLQEQVAKLIANGGGVAAGDGVGDLISFLDRIGCDRREILGEIPFTAAVGVAEPGGGGRDRGR